MTADERRVHKFHFLEEIQVEKVGYAIMMDSLEYMEDDVGYIRNMGKKIMVRFVQKMFHLPIDPERKFTAGWKYAQNNFLARFLTMCLNFDFKLNRMPGPLGIRLPGLSMLVVCRKI